MKGAYPYSPGCVDGLSPRASRQAEYVVLQEGVEPVWQSVALEGNWFPHAFMGSMRQLMEVAAGKRERPDNSVEDAIDTMACVEAAYRSGGKQTILLADIL